MDSSIVKATLKIKSLRKESNGTSIQFADALRKNLVRCKNAYPEGQTKCLFIDRLPANTPSAVRMFWGREQNAHFLVIVQYADALLEQTPRFPETARGASYRKRNEQGRRSNFVAMVLNHSPSTEGP